MRKVGRFPSIAYSHSEKQFKLEKWREGERLGGLLSVTLPHNEFYFKLWGWHKYTMFIKEGILNNKFKKKCQKIHGTHS
jgi:hypothetical protein